MKKEYRRQTQDELKNKAITKARKEESTKEEGLIKKPGPFSWFPVFVFSW